MQSNTAAARGDLNTTELIVHLTQAISSDLGLPEVIRAVTESGTALSGATVGAFLHRLAMSPTGGSSSIATERTPASHTHPSQEFPLRVVTGADARLFETLSHATTDALTAPAFQYLECTRTDDTAHDLRYPADVPWRSLLATPVVTGAGEVIGALVFAHPEPQVFNQTAEAYIRAVATHAAVAIQNARLFAAERAARQDAEYSAMVTAWLQELTAALARATTVDQAIAAVSGAFRGAHRPDHTLVFVNERGGVRDLTDSSSQHPWFSGLADQPPNPLKDALELDEVIMVSGVGDFQCRYPEAVREFPNLRSVVAVPFRSDRTSGALILAWTTAQDLSRYSGPTLRSVGDQLASTLERVRLFRAEAAAQDKLRRHLAEVTEASQTLQRALLPHQLPDVPGLGLAARYRPGGPDAEVGGDWYDLVLGRDGRATVVIGDVEGHNFSAAAVMAQISSALRAYLAEGHPADVAVSRVNHLVDAAGVLATCIVVTANPATGELEWVRAGHPLPLLQTAGGTVTQLDVNGGPPLGLPGATWPVTRHHVEPGTRLLMFTDGLTERRSGDATDRAVELLGLHPHQGLQLLVDDVLETVAADATDDVALVALEVLGKVDAPVVATFVSSECDISTARAFVTTQLLEWGLVELIDKATLVVSELCTNAVRHGGGYGRLELSAADDGLHVAVHDSRPQEPTLRHAEPDEAGGRGMLLVNELADSWGSHPNGDGKVVWAQLSGTHDIDH